VEDKTLRLRFLNGLVVALVAFTPGLATAGNIALTGHDDDFHQSTGAMAQIGAMIGFARDGSTLPVLVFDSGSELTSALTTLGIPFTNVDPNSAAAVTDALFNHSLYSAVAVASDTTCGGCDNSAGGEANIAAHSTAIGNFLNAGGGIVGFAGAFSADYYAFVPQTASSVGGAPSTGYTATGLFGINAVNGDATHNLFWNPGTHGESKFYQIAEINTTSGNGTIPPPAAVTLVCDACTVSGGVITGGGGSVPEPATYEMMAGGIAALGLIRKLRARV
jgi:hypothetical protein